MGAPYTELENPVDELSLVCRGCLVDSGEMKNIFEWGLADDFLRFTNIQVHKMDGLSELLCTNCEEALLSCKKFKDQCLQSDLYLHERSRDKLINTKIGKIKNTINCEMLKDKLLIRITAPDVSARINLPCPYHCEEVFSKKSDLLGHLVRYHQTAPSYKIDLEYFCSFEKCAYYNKSVSKKCFSGRKFLNQHYNKVHRSKIFHCESCGNSFSIISDFNRHLKTCNMAFKCTMCDNEYNTNEKLLVHIMRKHPESHKQYKDEKKAEKRKAKIEVNSKKAKIDTDDIEYICDSPKRTSSTQTSKQDDNINDEVTIFWDQPAKADFVTKTDEISTQTVFEDLLSLKSQTSEDESLFFSETVSLSDIQTQTFPLEFGLSRSNKETITSETQSPDLSIKETQTCFCLYDSPRVNTKLFDSVMSSPSSINFTTAETQTPDFHFGMSDVMMNFNSTETQTQFDSDPN